MGKRHITIRINEDVADALDRRAGDDGASRSEVVERLLRASLCDATEAPQEADSGQGGPSAHDDGERAVVEVLRASNADLRAEVSRLWAQMAEKDRQIQEAHELADQAHRLHAAEVSRALPESKGRGFAERVAAMFRRGEQ